MSAHRTDLYGTQFQTTVKLGELPNHLCGVSRPVFFTGVATVVAKLFNIVRPQFAVFGKKDYQQFIIIRQMVKDLNFPVEIVGVSTVRETDGLAMSSRNSYLSLNQRPAALSLYASLRMAADMVNTGMQDAYQILRAAKELITSHPETSIDYITICDPQTLVQTDHIDRPVLMAMAVKVGGTRLIDNMILTPNPNRS